MIYKSKHQQQHDNDDDDGGGNNNNNNLETQKHCFFNFAEMGINFMSYLLPWLQELQVFL